MGVTISTPAIHSSTVRSFSRAKSWICCIKLCTTCRIRGDALGPVALSTVWVKLGSNFVPRGVVVDGFSVVALE